MNKPIRLNRFALAGLISLAATHAAQAQTSWTSVSDFKEAAGSLIGIIVIVSFVIALILWGVGAAQKENNPGASSWCFKTAWTLAIGVPVISLLFYMFVGSGAVVQPRF